MQSQYARMAIAVVTVLIWMAAGWIFHLSGNAYLVVGMPYLLVFQFAVARRPLGELWLRPPSPRERPWWTWVIVGAFAVFPAIYLGKGWETSGWPVRLWLIGAVVGAIPLGWAWANVRGRTLKYLALCFATAGTWGVLVFAAASALHHHRFEFHDHAWKGFGVSFVLYMPVCCVMEEVFFRGGLDSFVQRPGDPHRWGSAALVSLLWGFWHLPISGTKTWVQFAVLVVVYPLFHLPFGLWFSTYWRRSGNLLVPATVHAFIDAFRNVVI